MTVATQLEAVANELQRHKSTLKAKEASLLRKLQDGCEQQETIRQRRIFYENLESNVGPKTTEAQSSLRSANEEFHRCVLYQYIS